MLGDKLKLSNMFYLQIAHYLHPNCIYFVWLKVSSHKRKKKVSSHSDKTPHSVILFSILFLILIGETITNLYLIICIKMTV